MAVFAYFQFVRPPLFFNPVELAQARAGASADAIRALEQRQDVLFREKLADTQAYLHARHTGDAETIQRAAAHLQERQKDADDIHAQAAAIIGREDPSSAGNDTNYIFLTFVLHHLPVGIVGLVIACIFLASMSSSASELSALATISMVDIYGRFIQRERNEARDVRFSRVLMVFWGIYGIGFAQFANRLGSLVEAVNILGSLFYGTMLGIFLLAFLVRSVGGTAAFIGAIAGECVVLSCFFFTPIAWLWYNVAGCAVVVGVGVLLTAIGRRSPAVGVS